MNPLGIHHIAEFVNCHTEYLNVPEKLEEFVLEGIKKSGLKHRNIISHKFEPVGVTLLAIISESHISMHTYPEADSASVDVFTCSDPKKQLKFLKLLEKKLKPELVRVVEVQRGNTIDIIDKNWIISEADYDFEIKYHVKKKLFEGKSDYQWIDIVENDTFGRMLFLDRDLQIAEYDAHIYNEAILRPISAEPGKFKEVAIFGGGDGGILKELLKLKPEKVTLIDIDKMVIELSKKYLKKVCGKAFDDPRAEIVNEDVNKYMNKMKSVDAIVSDLTMHPETFTHLDRPTYLKRLFGKIKRKLRKNGVLTMQVCSSFDTETFALVDSLLKELFPEVEYRRVYIPSFAEEWVFATAKK